MTQLERLQMVEDAMPKHLDFLEKRLVVDTAIQALEDYRSMLSKEALKELEEESQALFENLLRKSREKTKPVEKKPYSYGYHESEDPAYRTLREWLC